VWGERTDAIAGGLLRRPEFIRCTLVTFAEEIERTDEPWQVG
jgi:hypothetical protein